MVEGEFWRSVKVAVLLRLRTSNFSKPHMLEPRALDRLFIVDAWFVVVEPPSTNHSIFRSPLFFFRKVNTKIPCPLSPSMEKPRKINKSLKSTI